MTSPGVLRLQRRRSAVQLVVAGVGLGAVVLGTDPRLALWGDQLRIVQGALQPVDLNGGALGAAAVAWLPWVFRRRTHHLTWQG